MNVVGVDPGPAPGATDPSTAILLFGMLALGGVLLILMGVWWLCDHLRARRARRRALPSRIVIRTPELSEEEFAEFQRAWLEEGQLWRTRVLSPHRMGRHWWHYASFRRAVRRVSRRR